MPAALAKNILKLAQNGLDWLLPPLCPATGQEVDAHGTVAYDYWASLRFIRKPYCSQCALPFPHDLGGVQPEGLICAACMEYPPTFRRARAALIYDDASRKIILRYKSGDQLQAVRAFVPWMREAGADVLAEADVLVPVPLHRFRLLRRRYNQSALLAQRLGRPVCVDALERIKRTVPQGSLSRKERDKNVRGAFRVNPARVGQIAGKTVLLVDDVFTTGATLNACADALYKAGAAAVDVLAIARVPKD
ncbi:MAG: ComF family protein [Alphaproteobacteria bacterium]|nr:ComF family protein [Alphaproteobacteria bacterium]